MLNESNDTHSAAMYKQAGTIMCRKATSPVAVIKNTNGSNLKCHHVTALPSWLIGKYLVQSLADKINRSPLKRVYTLTPNNLTELKTCSNVSLANADQITNNLSDDTLVTVCVDDSTLSNLTNVPVVLSQLFIGLNPTDTSAMQEYQPKDM